MDALLQSLAPLLRRAPHARLREESIVLWGCAGQVAAATTASLGRRAPQLTPASFAASHEPVARLVGLALAGSADLPGWQPTLRTAWAPATPAPCPHSSASLLLALRPVFEARVASHLRPPPMVGGADACAWAAAGCPASLAHLAAVSAPRASAVAPLVAALQRCSAFGDGPSSLSSAAPLFRWELATAAGVQGPTPPAAGALRCVALERPAERSHRSTTLIAALPCRALTYSAHPDAGLLLVTAGSPLLVAVVASPLAQRERVAAAAAPLKAAGVKQLLSSFRWDAEHAEAELLLPSSMVDNPSVADWFVQLVCLSADDAGATAAAAPARLRVVGKPARLGSLPSRTVDGAAPWRRLWSGSNAGDGAADAVAFSTRLLDKIAVAQPAGDGWAHDIGPVVGDGMRVDLLAPSPLASGVAVSATVAGGVLSVRVASKVAATFDLGISVADGQPAECMLCRPLGLLCLRFAASQ